MRWVLWVMLLIWLRCHPLHSAAPRKPMQGYQRRPCRGTPAPGGSVRYSLSMTAGPFCIRKAILIHEPINTDTIGFASTTPPPPFGLFVSFFFFCNHWGKAAVKLLYLSEDQRCARLDGRNNGGSMGGGAYHQWLPIRRLSGCPALALCLWDNQRTCPLHPEGALSSMDEILIITILKIE